MALLRQLFFLFFRLLNMPLLLINKVAPSAIEINGFLLIFNKGEITFGKGGKINSSPLKNIIGGDTRSTIVVKKGANLIIGDNFRMSNSAIYCADEITIGNNVMIGGSCKLWDTDFHPLNADERTDNPNEGYRTKPITIGDGVFIGGCSIILKGVTIGNNAIVGAGSVVSKDIGDGEVWVGNPAQKIR